LDGTYGQLESPPTVPHNYILLEEGNGEVRAQKRLADVRQETLKKDAIRQERKQLLAGLQKLEGDEDAPVHWAYALPCQEAGERHDLPIGSRVIYSQAQDVLTVIGHGPHGTYNLAKVDYSEVHFCAPPAKVQAVGTVRTRRVRQRVADSDSS
jgi:hypothetical protein